MYHFDLSAVYGRRIGYDVTLFEEYYDKARKALEQQNDEAANEAFMHMVELYFSSSSKKFISFWQKRRFSSSPVNVP